MQDSAPGDKSCNSEQELQSAQNAIVAVAHRDGGGLASRLRWPVRNSLRGSTPLTLVPARSRASTLRSPRSRYPLRSRTKSPGWGVSWRLIVGADPRTFEQFVNAQPLTCRRQLLVP